MFHSTSGKEFYSPYRRSTNFNIDKETLRKILIREEELRFSREYLEGCDAAQEDKDLAKIRDLTVGIQRQVLEEFGIDWKKGLTVLNNVRYTYQDDPEMNKLTVYLRQDRSTLGTLGGNLAETPDAALLTLQGEPTSLHQYLKSLRSTAAEGEPRPVVILSGSLT